MSETVKRVVRQANELISEARNVSTYADRAALYALARVYGRDLEETAAEDFGDDAYLREKAGQFQWHMGAALGFDETNGHDAGMHRTWALGAVSSYEGRIENLND